MRAWRERQNCRSTLFWTGNWINGESIQALAPAALIELVNRRSGTLAEALPDGRWIGEITGGLSAGNR